MFKPNKEDRKTQALKWIVLGLVILLLSVGGYFGYRYYQDYQANKIYSKNEVVPFLDFELTVTKADFKAVDFPLSESQIEKYGDIDSPENCNIMSDEDTWIETWEMGWVHNGASRRDVCERRNEARSDIKQYLMKNKQLVVDYRIVAKNNLDTSKFKITLLPESGRNPKENVYIDSILSKGGQGEIITKAGAPGPVYDSIPSYDEGYVPYHQSKIGGDINRGLTREGYIYTDIRNTEKSVDLKVSYDTNGEEHVRIIRIER